MVPYSSMIEDSPEDSPRGIDELIQMDFSALDCKELVRVRDYHEAQATSSPTPTEPDLVETLKHVFGEEQVLDFTGEVDGGGIKQSMFGDFIVKPPMSLIPRALLDGCARALGFGANKYAANNWRRGMKWSSPTSGLLRHIAAWTEGEDNDPESGLSHLDHAAACLAFIMHYSKHEAYKSLDDRP